MDEKNFEVIDLANTLEQTVQLQKYVLRHAVKGFFGWGIVFAIIGIVMLLLDLSSVSMYLFCFAVVFIVLAATLKSAAKKNGKTNFEKSKGKTELLHVYSDFMEYHVLNGETKEVFLHIPSDKITGIAVMKDIYVFKYENVAFGIAKENVPDDGTLFKLLFPSGKASAEKPRGKAASIWFLCLMLVSVFCAFGLFSLIELNPSLWWTALAGLALPTAMLIILGVNLSDGVKIKHSVIGVIIAILSLILMLLSMVGGIVSLFGDSFEYDNSSLYDKDAIIYEVADITISDYDEYYANTYKIFDDNIRKYIEVKNTTFYFTDEQNDAFCGTVEASDVWVTELEEETYGYFEPYIDYYGGEVYFVYNKTEGTYNSLPTSQTPCEYAVVVFTGMYNYVDIYEFAK